MNYTRLEYDDQYDIMNVLPRWAYSGSEWEDMIVECDKIVNGIMYVKVIPVEPEVIHESVVFLDNMFENMKI